MWKQGNRCTTVLNNALRLPLLRVNLMCLITSRDCFMVTSQQPLIHSALSPSFSSRMSKSLSLGACWRSINHHFDHQYSLKRRKDKSHLTQTTRTLATNMVPRVLLHIFIVGAQMDEMQAKYEYIGPTWHTGESSIWPQLQAVRPPTLAKWPPIGAILTRTSSSMQRSTAMFNMQPLDPEGQWFKSQGGSTLSFHSDWWHHRSKHHTIQLMRGRQVEWWLSRQNPRGSEAARPHFPRDNDLTAIKGWSRPFKE